MGVERRLLSVAESMWRSLVLLSLVILGEASRGLPQLGEDGDNIFSKRLFLEPVKNGSFVLSRHLEQFRLNSRLL